MTRWYLGLLTTMRVAALSVAAQAIYAEPADANRQDNSWVFDTRFEKTFHTTRLGARLLC